MPPLRRNHISKTRADRAGVALREFINSRRDLSDSELRAVATDVAAWRSAHAYPLALVTPGVRNWVGQATRGDVIVAQRMKRFDRILRKLDRFPTMRLTQMEDIAGCRAVLVDRAEVDAVAGRIAAKWDVRAVNDYRDEGKAGTGYRGLHIIVLRRERFVEVQLRTPAQQYWAEIIERTSSRLGFNLKDSEGPPDLLRYLEIASHLTSQAEAGEEQGKDLLEELTNLREVVRPHFQG